MNILGIGNEDGHSGSIRLKVRTSSINDPYDTSFVLFPASAAQDPNQVNNSCCCQGQCCNIPEAVARLPYIRVFASTSARGTNPEVEKWNNAFGDPFTGWFNKTGGIKLINQYNDPNNPKFTWSNSEGLSLSLKVSTRTYLSPIEQLNYTTVVFDWEAKDSSGREGFSVTYDDNPFECRTLCKSGVNGSIELKNSRYDREFYRIYFTTPLCWDVVGDVFGFTRGDIVSLTISGITGWGITYNDSPNRQESVVGSGSGAKPPSSVLNRTIFLKYLGLGIFENLGSLAIDEYNPSLRTSAPINPFDINQWPPATPDNFKRILLYVANNRYSLTGDTRQMSVELYLPIKKYSAGQVSSATYLFDCVSKITDPETGELSFRLDKPDFFWVNESVISPIFPDPGYIWLENMSITLKKATSGNVPQITNQPNYWAFTPLGTNTNDEAEAPKTAEVEFNFGVADELLEKINVSWAYKCNLDDKVSFSSIFNNKEKWTLSLGQFWEGNCNPLIGVDHRELGPQSYWGGSMFGASKKFFSCATAEAWAVVNLWLVRGLYYVHYGDDDDEDIFYVPAGPNSPNTFSMFLTVRGPTPNVNTYFSTFDAIISGGDFEFPQDYKWNNKEYTLRGKFRPAYTNYYDPDTNELLYDWTSNFDDWFNTTVKVTLKE